jgi:glycosyltransferase involved in cell wall biosynthesis
LSIAILLATHNASRFIGETLHSISLQERQPDEVIVIDDASVDSTVDIVARWAKVQKFAVRIEQNRLPHKGISSPGPAGSRTTGLLLSQCDLIATLDDDDLMLPCHLRLTEQALRVHPELELCFGDASVFYESSSCGREEPSFLAGKPIEGLRYREQENGLRILLEPMLPALVGGNFIPTAANLWRRKTGVEIGGFDRRAGGSDDLLFFSTISRLGKVGYYPFPIARRRVLSTSLSHSKNALRHCWDHLNILTIMLDRANTLRLNREERDAIRRCILPVETEILYHASRRGIPAYLESKKKLGELARTRSRDVLRALVFTGRHAAGAASRRLKLS